MLAGFTPAGRKVRAVCTCGLLTTPRVDEARAADARSEHANSHVVCARCGRDREDRNLFGQERYNHLRMLVDGEPMDMPTALAEVLAIGDDDRWTAWRERDQVLVCRDDLELCAALTESRTRLTALETAGPARLQVIPGGRQ